MCKYTSVNLHIFASDLHLIIHKFSSKKGHKDAMTQFPRKQQVSTFKTIKVIKLVGEHKKEESYM